MFKVVVAVFERKVLDMGSSWDAEKSFLQEHMKQVVAELNQEGCYRIVWVARISPGDCGLCYRGNVGYFTQVLGVLQLIILSPVWKSQVTCWSRAFTVRKATSKMPRNPTIKVEWKTDEKMWVVAGGKLEEPTVVFTVEIRENFPIFVQAAEEFVKELESPLCEDDLEALLGCAANSYAEIVPSRKRFAVYRAVAFFLGFKERTQLPEDLEDAIKQTWCDPNEIFIGYRDG
ncbi:hypothetical protein R1sor_022843 [Riccia sorocarpa]|uniref:Uncharacterized protein n=1 Tax=Riccia sorocarpa TaxID=122646 RepID=A0ABD3GN36_9MARC